ncbi:MAG: hypothetical protein OQK64_03740 [Ignavibacteriaceae bacterium]|nr:hypothetical protein [Ignavibacteriaceae bacterium]
MKKTNMSQLNYPLVDVISSLKRNNNSNSSLEESGSELNSNTFDGKLGFNVNRKLVGKIKFILGFIYFFSFIYFMVELFT